MWRPDKKSKATVEVRALIPTAGFTCYWSVPESSRNEIEKAKRGERNAQISNRHFERETHRCEREPSTLERQLPTPTSAVVQ